MFGGRRRASTMSAPARRASTGTFAHNYSLGRQLGMGSFAEVKEAIHKRTGEAYAVKIRPQVCKSDENSLKDEISILIQLKHPNVVALRDIFRDNGLYYIVLEKMNGGELFDRIAQKECYSEVEARDICSVLFDAVRYIHKKRIAHRDLKPENLLLASRESDTDIKIADFGFAKQLETPYSLQTMVGSDGFCAPEVLMATPYDVEVDMWSVGVIVYILLGGYPPFDGPDADATDELVCNGRYRFDLQYWAHISLDAKELITGLLQVNRKKRLTAEAALKHKWIVGDNAQDLTDHDLQVNLQELVKFNARRKFRGAALAVMVSQNMITALHKQASKQQQVDQARSAPPLRSSPQHLRAHSSTLLRNDSSHNGCFQPQRMSSASSLNGGGGGRFNNNAAAARGA